MPSFDTRVPAVLVRLDRNPFHHGTLGAARSLGRAGVPVHAVLESPTSPAARSRYVHTRPTPASPTALPAALTDLLLRLSGRHATPALLVPLDDLSALALAEHRAELTDRYLLPDQSAEQLARVADKAALAETCRALALPHPPTGLPESAEEAATMAWSLGLPVVAKWSRPWLLPPGSGLRSTSIVRSLADVRALYARTAEAGSRLLLQQLLPPGRELDWFVHGYADSAGRCAAGATGRKERSWPGGAGLTAVGRWAANPAIERAAGELLSALGYRGVFDLDFRLDRSTGAYHLLDFNPRPGAQFRLFADADGLDVVRAMHLDLTGRPVPAHSPSYGRRFVVENYAALSVLTSPRRRYAPEPADTPRGRTETAWFAADDLTPAFAMAGAWFLHSLRKAVVTLRRLLWPDHPRRVTTVSPPARTASDRMTRR
ncbi:ATP-grasp domain-containing protein [Streptomyces sp. Je 1-79]|uniref:carboxylate--amine ligase n=1 Tax=Streptomyces sp. Je 1-79 TaxID=2943847 RepID=UPI0021A75C80|nr:ATP-grasp domain-containing protein [Streptomyces sp. Je 1-79]MCT4355606.1 ATP-grasp domain-containing protein [Streptomyces sp. Je 1-79]